MFLTAAGPGPPRGLGTQGREGVNAALTWEKDKSPTLITQIPYLQISLLAKIYL